MKEFTDPRDKTFPVPSAPAKQVLCNPQMTSETAWHIMRDDVTLRHSLMVGGFTKQRDKDLLRLHDEDRRKGNAGYYLPARVELEIRDIDERAQALYQACLEVWENNGFERSRVFYRAVFENCLQGLFSIRRDTVSAELRHEDNRTGRAGHSNAALGSLARGVDQLRATWNQKLEKETRDCETRERVARERAALPSLTATQSAAINHRALPTSLPIVSEKRASQRAAFEEYAAGLWRQKQNANRRVITSDLVWIADELDSHSFTPPSKFLESEAANELKAKNSKRANSKAAGPILTWKNLVKRGDKDNIAAMRKKLSRCASKHP